MTATKPTSDQVRAWMVEALERGRRAQIQGDAALVDMVLRDLQAKGVRLVWDGEETVPVYRPRD